ncbi:MAG: tryptophan--tRNA ligase [Candidatus Parcubacteria bacterium]|jgi:tryptophanyl-tRNA synthetase
MNTICLTGIKPTGKLHIGNYFGSMQPLLELSQQSDFDKVLVFIANLHALNSIKDAKTLREYTYDIALDYLSLGLDLNKTSIFLQSDIKALTELTWIFNNLITVAYLERSHAYKDAVANGKEANMGLFDYPVLMAADILLYNSNLVPVGQDQKQHLEIAQTIAKKFNSQYGQFFTIPKPYIQENTAIVKGLDGRKMSKSYKNTIEIFESADSIRAKVMKITTDSKAPNEPKDPDTCNIMSIYRLLVTPENLAIMESRYREGRISYKEAKEILAEAILEFFQPMRTRRQEFEQNPEYVAEILAKGAKDSNFIATNTMKKVADLVGLNL